MFMTVAVIFFAKFSLVNIKFLIYTWRAKNASLFNESSDQIRRKFFYVYSKVCKNNKHSFIFSFTPFFQFHFCLIFFYLDIVLIAAFILLYFLDNAMYYLIFIAYSFWVPQILRNIVNNAVDTLSPFYVAGTSLTKLYTPLYLLTYKSNFLMVKTNKLFGIVLVFHVTFQNVILFLQRISRRPRLFMPQSLLPEKYDYFRKIPKSVRENAANGRLECVICMEHVNVPTNDDGDETDKNKHVNEDSVLEEGNRTEYMITPCDHVYHKECLMRWLDCKLECPFCRAPIPSP